VIDMTHATIPRWIATVSTRRLRGGTDDPGVAPSGADGPGPAQGAATVSVVAGPAHADLHITAEAFDRLVWQLQAPLQELEVRQQVQQAIPAAVQARRDAVVTFEKSSSTALLPRDRVDI
jgi:hypothetical protein